MIGALRRSVLERAALRFPCWLALSAICVSFTFGGGTRQWLPSEFICQAFGLVFLAVGIVQAGACANPRRLRFEFVLVAVAFLLPALQLVPLPPFLWSRLPGRGFLVEEFQAIGAALPWQSISLWPAATWQAMFSLALPASVFVVTLLLTFSERRLLSLVVLAFVGLSILLAFLQQVDGPESPLRFYTITNASLPVGLFANRNHFAAFLYCALPLSVAWTITLGMSIRRSRRTGRIDPIRVFAFAFFALGLVALLLMQALVHSRAGLLITGLATLLSLSLVIPYRKSEGGKIAIKVMLAVFAVVAILIGFYALSGVIQQFDRDPIEDARFTIISGALQALRAFFPVGSGFGTFDLVYQQFERPGLATAEYINRAHDDVIETIMEGGMFTVMTMVLFAAWLARRVWRVWTAPEFRDASTIDATLARASAFVPLLLVVHSFLDYPLRTEAVMSFLAFSCALIVPPVTQDVEQQERPARPSRTRESMPQRAAPGRRRPA